MGQKVDKLQADQQHGHIPARMTASRTTGVAENPPNEQAGQWHMNPVRSLRKDGP